jgi:hypothetical protein
MIWVIVIAIIGVVIFFFLRDRDKMLNSQVDGHGGMRQKYSQLISWMTSDPRSKVVKIKRDHIQISCVMQTTATHFFITETFNGVEIDWKAYLGMMGNHKLSWKFQSTISDEDIIIKIGSDLEEYQKKLY